MQKDRAARIIPFHADDIAGLLTDFKVKEDWALGFFTAVHSGPAPLDAKAWLSALPRETDDAGRAARAFERILRLHEGVGSLLRDDGRATSPNPKNAAEVSRWCKGYLAGAALHPTWRDDTEARAQLDAIGALAEDGGPKGFPREQLDALRLELPKRVSTLWDHWKEARKLTPFVRDAAKVGRNDPCSCGSGKKYKKCHGA